MRVPTQVLALTDSPNQADALARVSVALGKRRLNLLTDSDSVAVHFVAEPPEFGVRAATNPATFGVLIVLTGAPGEVYGRLRQFKQVLSAQPLWRPLSILISLDRSLERQQLVESSLEDLATECEARDVPLLLVDVGGKIVARGTEVDLALIAQCQLYLIEHLANEGPLLEPLDISRIISANAHLLVDHFRIRRGSREFHVPLLAESSVLAELTATPTLIASIQGLMPLEPEALGAVRLVPVDISGGNLDIWCAALADDPGRVVDLDGVLPGDKVLLVTDFYHVNLGFKELEGQLAAVGATVLGVLACFSYGPQTRMEGDGTWLVALVDLPGHFAIYEPEDCPYCSDSVPLVQSEQGYSGYARELRKPHPRCFWDMLRWSHDFVEVGHWRSTVTANHFQFRILGHQVLRVFAHLIATRMKNELSDVLMENWIDCVASTDGPDRLVSRKLVDFLRLPKRRSWIVPRDELPPTSASAIVKLYVAENDDIEHYTAQSVSPVSSEDLESIGGRPNVVVIDQAAHHFYTFEGVQRAIEGVRGRPLTLSVLVDRYSDVEEEATPLTATRYLPLYNWPAEAMTGWSCACSSGRA